MLPENSITTGVDALRMVKVSKEAEEDYINITRKRNCPLQEIAVYAERNLNAIRISGYYYRLVFYDRTIKNYLMLFLYNVSNDIWEVVGISHLADWNIELEESGQIRVWLNSKFDDRQRDWVLDERAERWCEEKEENQVEVQKIKVMLRNSSFEQKKILMCDDAEKKAKMLARYNRLMKCVDLLDNEDKQIVKDHYFNGKSLAELAAEIGISKGGMQYRLEKAVKIIAMLYEE